MKTILASLSVVALLSGNVHIPCEQLADNIEDFNSCEEIRLQIEENASIVPASIGRDHFPIINIRVNHFCEEFSESFFEEEFCKKQMFLIEIRAKFTDEQKQEAWKCFEDYNSEGMGPDGDNIINLCIIDWKQLYDDEVARILSF